MILKEFYDNPRPEAYQDLSQDQSTMKPTDLRKTRLTLAQISQLRKMNDQRTVEKAEHLQKVKIMYGAPPAAEGAAPPA
jgi:hypothetical protein